MRYSYADGPLNSPLVLPFLNNSLHSKPSTQEGITDNQHYISCLMELMRENLVHFRHVEMERMAFTALFAAAVIASLALVSVLSI
jgi:hypothetical protein